jgi:hypothetical protein
MYGYAPVRIEHGHLAQGRCGILADQRIKRRLGREAHAQQAQTLRAVGRIAEGL